MEDLQQTDMSEIRNSLGRLRNHSKSLISRYRELKKGHAAALLLSNCLLCEEDLLKEQIRETQSLCRELGREYRQIRRRQA